MKCEFEPALQWDCVRDAIAIVRSGNVGHNERMMLIQHVCCFAGSAAELAKGQPEPVGPFSNPQDIADLTTEAICMQLQEACPAIDEQGVLVGDGVNWVEVLKFVIPLLLELLRREQ